MRAIQFIGLYGNGSCTFFSAPLQALPRAIEELKDAALNAIREEDYIRFYVGYTEIENGSQRLFLIYENFEAWGLGYGDSVKVIESLSELMEKNGYYTFPRNKIDLALTDN